jgi:ribonucleoside-diphosphate reductase alpha chain
MTRQRLPNRRASYFFDFESMGFKFTSSISRYPDGRVGEIFIENHKAGSAIGTLVRDAAICFSIAVQNGADPNEIREALCRDSQGRAMGPLGVALDLLAEVKDRNT